MFSPPTGISAVAPALSQPGLEAAVAERRAYTVQDDGAISIPDIGRVRIVGLTMSETEQAIFEALLERQKEPSFSIEIAEFNSQRVNVSGLVAQPTAVPITLRPLYLRDALTAAGGAKVSNVEDGTVLLYRDGETFRMLLSDIYSDPSLGRRILKDGDSVYVGTLYSEERAKGYLDDQIRIFQAQNSARLNDRNAVRDQLEIGAYPVDRVYLVGEVKQQVAVNLPFGQKAMLADMLFSKFGRGFDLRTANVSQIYVLRFSELSRRVTAYHLDARSIGNLVVASKLEMRPNDFIFISEQPITAWNRVIQQLVPSVFFGAINTAQN